MCASATSIGDRGYVAIAGEKDTLRDVGPPGPTMAVNLPPSAELRRFARFARSVS